SYVVVIDSKLDNLDVGGSAIDAVNSTVDRISSVSDEILQKVCTTESVVDAIDSKVDNLALDTSLLPIINETTMHIDCGVGSKTDLAFSNTDIFSTLDGINSTDISVISWLKTIMSELRGV
ncbi:MAG: hypothetical protein WD055_03855, partial [Candidatus Dependentiae bacterium]